MQLFSAADNLVLCAHRASRRGAPPDEARHLVFEAGRRFWAANETIPYVVFPLRGVISLQTSADGRKGMEVAQVGREGFAGISLLLGSDKAYTAAVAITPGEALLVPADLFRQYLRQARFRAAAERYCIFLITMLQCLSTCNRVHGIHAAFVGRLLLMHDRTDSLSFGMTQGAFASRLGVRRASISRSASCLQKLGAIAYDNRGRLMIVDRTNLERFACSCYRAIKNEFDALLNKRANSSMGR